MAEIVIFSTNKSRISFNEQRADISFSDGTNFNYARTRVIFFYSEGPFSSRERVRTRPLPNETRSIAGDFSTKTGRPTSVYNIFPAG